MIKLNDSQNSILTALELNRSAFYLSFYERVPGAQLVHRPDITYVATGLDDASMNIICRTRSTDDEIKLLISDVIAYFKLDEVPFSWTVGPLSEPKNIGKYVLSQGLFADHDELGMVYNLEHYEHPGFSELDIKRCLTPQEITDFGYVIRMNNDTLAYHQLWSQLTHAEWVNSDPLKLYVGYKDGHPTTCGMLFTHGGIAGIYMVSTLTEERGKGYATELVRYLLANAQQLGYKVATAYTITSSAMFYQKIGFMAYCAFQIYSMNWHREHYEFGRK